MSHFILWRALSIKASEQEDEEGGKCKRKKKRKERRAEEEEKGNLSSVNISFPWRFLSANLMFFYDL